MLTQLHLHVTMTHSCKWCSVRIEACIYLSSTYMFSSWWEVNGHNLLRCVCSVRTGEFFTCSLWHDMGSQFTCLLFTSACQKQSRYHNVATFFFFSGNVNQCKNQVFVYWHDLSSFKKYTVRQNYIVFEFSNISATSLHQCNINFMPPPPTAAGGWRGGYLMFHWWRLVADIFENANTI